MPYQAIEFETIFTALFTCILGPASGTAQPAENDIASYKYSEMIMTESKVHKRAKAKAAGRSGITEKRISRGRRVDAVSNKRLQK